MRKAAAVFSLFCGVAMLIVWRTLLGTGNVPELKTTPLTSFRRSVAAVAAIAVLKDILGTIHRLFLRAHRRCLLIRRRPGMTAWRSTP